MLCPKNESGCTAIIDKIGKNGEQLDKHINECSYFRVHCPNRCYCLNNYTSYSSKLFLPDSNKPLLFIENKTNSQNEKTLYIQRTGSNSSCNISFKHSDIVVPTSFGQIKYIPKRNETTTGNSNKRQYAYKPAVSSNKRIRNNNNNSNDNEQEVPSPEIDVGKQLIKDLISVLHINSNPMNKMELVEHLKVCPHARIACQYAHMGCNSQIPRYLSKAHESAMFENHLSLMDTYYKQKLLEKDEEEKKYVKIPTDKRVIVSSSIDDIESRFPNNLVKGDIVDVYISSGNIFGWYLGEIKNTCTSLTSEMFQYLAQPLGTEDIIPIFNNDIVKAGYYSQFKIMNGSSKIKLETGTIIDLKSSTKQIVIDDTVIPAVAPLSPSYDPVSPSYSPTSPQRLQSLVDNDIIVLDN